jgi:hypothetical protein
MNPFQCAKSVFDDTPMDFWAQVRAFLEYGYVFTDPDKYFCMACPVNSDEDPSNWMVGSGGEVDAWYIHLFGGPAMLDCYHVILGVMDLPKVCFYRYKNGEQGELRVYNKDRFMKRLEN